MDNIKDSKYYISKIIDDIIFTIESCKNINYQEFKDNMLLNSAISFKFIQISENCKKLPKELIESNSNVPWNQINGLRNKIVHDYGNIQLDIIYNTIKNDFEHLLESLSKIIIE